MNREYKVGDEGMLLLLLRVQYLEHLDVSSEEQKTPQVIASRVKSRRTWQYTVLPNHPTRLT